MGVLKGLVIALAGDIKDSSNTTISTEQLKRWINANDGRWTSRVGPGTTHLICSADAWKKGVESVKHAQTLSIPVVSYDWLEDSLQKRRRLVERKYTLEVQRAQRRTRKTMKRLGPLADKKKFDAGCELASQDLGSGTSSKRSGGFFASSLEELRRMREARDKETRENMGLAPGEDVAMSKSRPADPQRRLATSPSTPAQRFPTGHQDGSHFGTTNPPTKHADNTSLASSASHSRITTATTPAPPKPTPSPSLFPPDLAYTSHPSSSSSSSPGPPSHFISQHPTRTAPQTPNPPANIANIKDLYHIYMDGTGFEYKLLLLRPYPEHNTFARYDLRLYESHTRPHVYCTFVRYIPPALPASTPAPASASASASTSTSLLPSSTPPLPPPSAHVDEATRLTSLITPYPPHPSPCIPHRRLLTPLGSSFPPSFRAFRHVFRDLTLLSWHERLDAPLQQLRARAFQLRPYEWRRPAEGLPTGYVAPPGLVGIEEGEGWRRNAWGLPGVEERSGEVEKVEEKEKEKEKEKEREKGRGKGGKKGGRKDGGDAIRPQYYEPRGQGASLSLSGSGVGASPGAGLGMGMDTPRPRGSTQLGPGGARSGTPVLPRGATPGKGRAIFLGDFDPRPAARRLWPSER